MQNESLSSLFQRFHVCIFPVISGRIETNDYIVLKLNNEIKVLGIN